MNSELLTQKVGPLPVYGWAGVAVAGALIYQWYTTRNTVAEPANAAYAYDETAGVLDNLGDVTGGGGPYAGSQPTQGTPPIVTNEQWARLAADHLNSLGTDPIVTASALRKYLDGAPLTVTERSIVSRAIALFGNPPEGVLSPGPTPVPTPTPPPFSRTVPNIPGRDGYNRVLNVFVTPPRWEYVFASFSTTIPNILSRPGYNRKVDIPRRRWYYERQR